MKIINPIILYGIVILIASFLYAENLTSKYNQMMKTAPVQTTATAETTVKNTENRTENTNYNLKDEIKKIEALKQDTFESSKDFSDRREQAIVELRNKVKFFAQNSSKEYSAGTAKMKSYDADKERMQLTLSWNNDLQSIFPEITKLKTVSLNISRAEAKELFEKKDTHYFHIDIAYKYNNLKISKMSIYDKFELYLPVVKKKAVKKAKTQTRESSSYKPYVKPSSSCQKYIVNIAQLNIRSYPNKGNNIIGAVYRGNTVCVYEFSERWRRINRGWISGKYLVPKKNYTTRNMGVVYGLDPRNDGFLSIRRNPKGAEIGRLYNGERVEILGKRGKWYKIKKISTDLVGWSHSKWISF